MPGPYFSRLCLIALTCCVYAPVANAADATLDAVSGSQGGQLGQFFALTDKRRRMADYHASLAPPQVALARVYLHHYPDSLDDDGFVEGYARHFFNEEFTQTQRSAEYRSSPFKRRSIIDGWRTRLANMETSETLTLNIFMPTMLNTNAYDFKKQSFPLTFSLREEAPLSSGVLGFACLKLDRTFSLSGYEVPENNAKAFMAENRNSRFPGRGASIFVGVQLKITGKPKTEGTARPRCPLAAEVLSIDAVEYHSSDDYSYSYAWPGAVMTSYYSRSKEATASAAVQIPYDERALATDAPPEAQAFHLETRKGLIIMPPRDVNPSWLAGKPKVQKALYDYGDFLSLGLHPDAFYDARTARCMTQKYLSAADDAAYFPDNALGNGWRGATEFEKKRSDAAFREKALPKLQARAVQTPQRYLILGDVTLPEYDFDKNGFWLNNLNATASMSTVFGHCFKRLLLLPMADQLHEFWSIVPAEAEAILNSMPISHTVGTRNIRKGYLATEVELVNLIAARPKQTSLSFVEQPPLRLKIISSHLYADEALTRVIFSPPIIRAAPSVLEAGLPESVTYSKSYQIDYGSGGDQLRVLKARGDFEEWEWPQLMVQQMARDLWYYSVVKPNYRPLGDSPGVPTEQDEQYTPFFPHGTEDRRSGLTAQRMTDKQKALFAEWAKRQAAMLP